VGCLREKNRVPSGERHELCRGSHAEQNAIVQAAAYGIPIRGAALFCTNLPCSICMKLIINAGIKTVFYEQGYPDPLSSELIREAGITLTNVGKDVK
jgi:dCMP deaminase